MADAAVEGRRGPSHLVLVGLPGAGKSTIGTLAAALLDVAFVDLDQEIEKRAGRSIREIFLADGESRFRQLEREATIELIDSPPSVVSPGGGWITQPDVVALIRPPARIIHLRVSPATAIARMGNELATRPLLSGEDPLDVLRRLERARVPLYETADAALDTEAVAVQELVSQVVALASSWGVGVG